MNSIHYASKNFNLSRIKYKNNKTIIIIDQFIFLQQIMIEK